MRSITNSSLVRRALVVSLGLALGASAAHAGSISDSYATGDTLTAGKMTAIKDAVNDNDTRISGVIANTQAGALKTEVDKISGIIANTQDGALKTEVDKISGIQTDVNNLKQNIATGSCGTGMTRVGPTCVDNARAASTASWSNAVNACRTAGKRLLTPGEYLAAKNSGNFSDMTVLEFVDAMFTNGGDADPRAGRLQVGYMGPSDGSGSVPAGEIFAGVNADYDVNYNFIYYRCAR